MDHRGHGLALNHPIFRTPNPVSFEYEEMPRPENYEDATSVLYPDGMGETLRLALFEHDKPDGWNPVLVNHEGFFTDVPGLENLAEGYSAKILGSVSLVRQGRWFYWGYSTDPERTTDAAKDTLVNVLHYMRGMRDSRTVRFVCTTRQILTVYPDLHRRSGYERGIQEHLPGQLTPESRADYEPTPEGCRKWLDRYLDYVFSGKGEQHRSERYKTVFEVDRDALALGTPNARRESLERWIELATSGAGEDRERALRCLDRYMHPDIVPADGDWPAWHQRYAERIVFIESTGFWWQEDPRILQREAATERR